MTTYRLLLDSYEYFITVSPNKTITSIIRFSKKHHIGTTLTYDELPWGVKLLYEQLLSAPPQPVWPEDDSEL